ncbi:MAG TPA: hypothetical protein VKU87_00660 [Thermomicrobiaceae bacterium]|nr:hypothetical protein [Thermomicrobiaceae bacterium]
MQSDFGPNRIAALLGEIGDGVGCRHRFEPEFGVSADLLVGAGLIGPINTKIPVCSEHGCPLIDSCDYEADFVNKAPGRGNRKFRLTAAGQRAMDDPSEMLVALTGSPVARTVMTSLASGPTSIFALAGELLRAEEQSARDDAPSLGYGRKDLGSCLNMLASLGLLAIEPDGTVRRLDELS